MQVKHLNWKNKNNKNKNIYYKILFAILSTDLRTYVLNSWKHFKNYSLVYKYKIHPIQVSLMQSLQHNRPPHLSNSISKRETTPPPSTTGEPVDSNTNYHLRFKAGLEAGSFGRFSRSRSASPLPVKVETSMSRLSPHPSSSDDSAKLHPPPSLSPSFVSPSSSSSSASSSLLSPTSTSLCSSSSPLIMESVSNPGSKRCQSMEPAIVEKYRTSSAEVAEDLKVFKPSAPDCPCTISTAETERAKPDRCLPFKLAVEANSQNDCRASSKLHKPVWNPATYEPKRHFTRPADGSEFGDSFDRFKATNSAMKRLNSLPNDLDPPRRSYPDAYRAKGDLPSVPQADPSPRGPQFSPLNSSPKDSLLSTKSLPEYYLHSQYYHQLGPFAQRFPGPPNSPQLTPCQFPIHLHQRLHFPSPSFDIQHMVMTAAKHLGLPFMQPDSRMVVQSHQHDVLGDAMSFLTELTSQFQD